MRDALDKLVLEQNSCISICVGMQMMAIIVMKEIWKASNGLMLLFENLIKLKLIMLQDYSHMDGMM
jgi:imidazoleglycerol phosphate synthase glutamine amidotransferase subunit HisH